MWKESVGDAGSYEGEWLRAAIFDFGGRQSELGYTPAGSDHCSEECTFTKVVEIKPSGADPIKVVLANSRVSIAGQYILVRPIKRNSHLYDVSTGESILGDVGRAAWVN